jgi:hypothetical protein
VRPSSAKAKGRRLQNEVAKLFQEFFGLPESDVRPAVMGESGCDIKMSERAQEVIWFDDIECKNVEALNIWAALAQGESRGQRPLLVFKRNRTETYVAFKLGFLLRLLRKIQVLEAQLPERDET